MRKLAGAFPLLMLLACCCFTAAQDQLHLVNVGRLCNASVYASGVNGGGDDDNPFYGARNAFDGDQNIVNGIHYSSWMSGKKSDWVRLRFQQYTGPLTVEAITVRTGDSQYLPDTMQVTIVFEDGQQQQSPVVNMTHPVTTYNLPTPAKNVSVMRIDFQAKTLFQVDEIQVLGQPSQYCHKTEGTPFFDGEYKNQLIIAARPKVTEKEFLEDPPIASALKEMEALHTRISSAQSPRVKAEAWLNLNRNADLLVRRMTELQPPPKDSAPITPSASLARLAEKSKALGIDVSWCEIGEGWTANPTGYENYLQLWPDGPNADEAFWKSKVEADGCGDFEGSVEEYEQLIKLYRGFIERFPASSYVEQAKSQLKTYEDGLQEEKQRQQSPLQDGHKPSQATSSKQ